jgi:hypothetical protein
VHFMHSAKALFVALLFTLLILLNGAVIVRADDEDVDADEYDVTARVMRTSLLEGEVNLRRAGNKQWERATLNLPLVEGDTLATSKDARLEIQIDARNFVRVGADSILRIVTLRGGGIVLSLVEGTATLRLVRFDRNQEYFEIDAPRTTVAAEKPGLYRLDVARGGGSLRLTVREGGRARIYSDTSGFTLRNDRTAELVYDNADEGDWQLSAAPSFDNWDTWVNERERYLAARLSYEQRDRYYDADIWGAEELDAYGDWVYASDYGGWVWRPHITVINNYYNWAPYRHGHWRWCAPYGWTWVGDEPWGWAPYHYGRWVYYNNNWCWAPRGYGYHNARNWWRPALVAFVYVPTSYGEHVAWYPLTYGQHDPYRSNHPRRAARLTPLRAGELNNLRRINPATVRAVTSVPAREFGNEVARLQPANADIARRAVAGEPVRARLPIAPADSDQNIANDRMRQTRGRTWPTARPAPIVPAETLQERPTGAAARQPGVPLDDELRRTRLFNGRTPRAAAPAVENGADPADQSTGAVARPLRPARRQPIEGDTDRDRNFRNNTLAPARPARPSARDEERQPASPDENVAPERRAERPTRTPRVEPPSPTEEAPPAESPGTIERSSPRHPERHAPVERDMPVERPARPQERQAAPPPQPEVRPEPQQRPDPPAPRREEPPPPAEPAHREETPPPPPPSSPPPREEPPPQRAPEPERAREAPAQPDRLPERGRDRPPLD